jgi:hypothetical protein
MLLRETAEDDMKRVAAGDMSDLEPDKEEDEAQQEEANEAPADEDLELADGTNEPTETENLPKDSSQQFEINPEGNVSFDFKEGNYKDLQTIPNKINQFTASFSRTFLPIVESALITLLGNSNNYKREKCQVSISLENNQPKLTGTIEYEVPLWVGDDISKESITEDAQAIYAKLQTIPNTQITQCKIDTIEGTLVITFITG